MFPLDRDLFPLGKTALASAVPLKAVIAAKIDDQAEDTMRAAAIEMPVIDLSVIALEEKIGLVVKKEGIMMIEDRVELTGEATMGHRPEMMAS